MARKLPETIREEELQQIIGTVKKPRHKLAFLLGFYNCLRVSEVVNLKPENVDTGRRLLLIKQAKGGKDRHIPIAPEVLKVLKHLPINSGVRALQLAFNKYSKKAIDRRLNFHLLRHSGATHYLNKKKWDIRQLQVFLGHSKIQTTEIYTHVNPVDLVNKMYDF